MLKSKTSTNVRSGTSGQSKNIIDVVKAKIGNSIFSQTLLAILGVSLVPVVGLVIANHRTTLLQGRALEKNMEQTAIAMELTVDNWLDINRMALEQNAKLPAVFSMKSDQQQPVMQALTSSYTWSYLAFTVGLDGYKTSRSDDKALVDENGKKAHFRGDRQYVQQVIEDERTLGHQLLISRTTGNPALCLSVPINRQVQLVGVAVSCSELVTISEVVTNTRIGETGIAILVDENNQLIAHGDEAVTDGDQLRSLDAYPALEAETFEEMVEFSWDGRKVVSYVRPVGLDGWKVIIQQNASEAYRPVVRSRWLTAMLMIGTGVLTLISAFNFSRSLTRPLKSLTNVADKVSQGKLDTPIEGSNRSDEIGILARAIKRLSISVAIALEELSNTSYLQPNSEASNMEPPK